MSPIPSVVTALPLSILAPSVVLDPDTAGQSSSVVSPHLIGTSGFVFAVVAIVSIAGYFYHRRRPANRAQTSNIWTSLGGFLSSMRYPGSGISSMGTAADWPPDLEAGLEVSRAIVLAFKFLFR